MRCNPETKKLEKARRADQWKKLQHWIEERNAAVEKSPKMNAASSLRQAQARLSRYRLTRWIKLALAGRKVEWSEDLPAKEAQGQLDGCYVVETDLPVESATTEAVHDRYLDLTKVERDFRTLKTGLLEIRPVFLRKANRTRGHALVSLLALKVGRELDRRVTPLGLGVDDAIERLNLLFTIKALAQRRLLLET